MGLDDRITSREATEALIHACQFAGSNATTLTFLNAEPGDLQEPVITTVRVTLCREENTTRGQPQEFLVVVVPAPPKGIEP